jgi:hypothetical protein
LPDGHLLPDDRRVAPKYLILMIPLAILAFAGCEAPQQRNAAEKVAIKKQAAAEIARICALHGAEREAELKKLKDVSGMDLYCSGE